MKHHQLDLFGGSRPWKSSDWTASDDRVRGGKSQSHLECDSSKDDARFYGDLDIKTLGGAGFASQRTTGDDWSLDLSEYDGVRLEIVAADSMTYTLIIKDELLPKNSENGREQATTSWEYDFTAEMTKTLDDTTMLIEVPWEELKPTYRGKPKENAGKVNTKTVKRFSIMVRSFFGTQEGSFDLTLRSITAYKGARCRVGNNSPSPYHDEMFSRGSDMKYEQSEKPADVNSMSQPRWSRPAGSRLSSWVRCCPCHD